MITDVNIEPVSIGQLNGWRVTTPYGSALVAQQGGQLLSYTPANGQPLVWLSEQANLTPGIPVRGGVPICWPWFGVYARNPQVVRDSVAAPSDAASHGWVRQVPWHLLAQHIEVSAAELEFGFDASPGCAPGWRHDIQLSLRMRFDQAVTLVLSARNCGQQACCTSLALHTYLAVSDSRAIEIHGLEGCEYLDMAHDWRRCQQSRPITIESETDRLYPDTQKPVVVHDPGWKRQVWINSTESRSTVVWNPWIDKAKRLADMADDGWKRMVCVETVRVLDDVLTVLPGETTSISVSIGLADN